MPKFTFFLFLFFAIITTSCVSYQKVELEILQPAQYSLKQPVQNLTILNNASEQADNIGHNNYERRYTNYQYRSKKEKTGSATIKVDSATNTCLYNLYNYLNETGFYQEINLVKAKAFPKVNAYTSRAYFEEYKSDALLVLEKLAYEDNYTVTHNNIYNTKYYELEVIVKSYWTLYFSQEPTQAYTYQVSDTLYWNQKNIDRKDCITHTIWENGAQSAKKISPYWHKTTRIYYSGNSYIYNQIEEAIARNDWKEAATHWKKIYDSKSNKSNTKARMAYNMALYFEVNNDFESALSWLRDANDIFTNTASNYEVLMCQDYAKTLQGRKLQKHKIDQFWGIE